MAQVNIFQLMYVYWLKYFFQIMYKSWIFIFSLQMTLVLNIHVSTEWLFCIPHISSLHTSHFSICYFLPTYDHIPHIHNSVTSKAVILGANHSCLVLSRVIGNLVVCSLSAFSSSPLLASVLTSTNSCPLKLDKSASMSVRICSKLDLGLKWVYREKLFVCEKNLRTLECAP